MQNHETLNGSTALVLYRLGRIEVLAETTQHEVRETRADMKTLTRRMDTLERRGPSQVVGDLLPYLTGVAVLVLALAGRWAELGMFLQR